MFGSLTFKKTHVQWFSSCTGYLILFIWPPGTQLARLLPHLNTHQATSPD